MRIDYLEGRAYVYTPYSAQFVTRVKQIGGAKWDREKKCWTIPEDAVGSCRDIMKEVYGETDIPDAMPKLCLRVRFITDYEERLAPVAFFGKNLASAMGRDSGAKVGDGVVLEKGEICSSGSAKNWTSMVKKDAVFLLRDVPQCLYERDYCAADRWGNRLFTVEKVQTGIDRRKLEEEKKALLKRIAQIDSILGQG